MIILRFRRFYTNRQSDNIELITSIASNPLSVVVRSLAHSCAIAKAGALLQKLCPFSELKSTANEDKTRMLHQNEKKQRT
jgi:hypothetical protein